jgi:hypothetical protein
MKNIKHFRFNVAGDFNLRGYFSLACKVARECPETQFLAFTKDYRIQELRKPCNFSIVLSVWKEYKPTKAKYGCAFFDDGTPECNVPETGFVCPDGCSNCLYCFRMKKNQAVIFKKH